MSQTRVPRFTRKRKIVAALALAVLLVLWLASSGVVAWKLSHRSSAPYPEPPPEVAWGKIEGHRLTTCDHQELGAWLVRGDRKKGCVLLLHGNGGGRREMLAVMQLLAEAHYTALAISLRAHGDSTGETNDIGWSARHDVVAGVDFLHREFSGQPVFIVGRSLGAAAAIFAGKELGDGVAGYFLEQPYKDLRSAVWHRLQHFLPPLADEAAYLGMRLWAPVLFPVSLDEVSPYKHVIEIPESVPLVFVSGSADRHAPLADVAAVAERVHSHTRLVVFLGAEHVALDWYNPKLYQSSLFDLLDRR